MKTKKRKSWIILFSIVFLFLIGFVETDSYKTPESFERNPSMQELIEHNNFQKLIKRKLKAPSSKLQIRFG